MYETYIVDELGDKIYKCSDLNDQEIIEILLEHPEWKRKCLSITTDNIF